MCHLQQYHFGKPSRNAYHNKAWAAMMEAVGLIPSATGEAGGKRTGQKVSHSIQPGGPFDWACKALLAEGFTIPWVALTSQDEEVRRKKAASKTKYACPSCALNVWGKPAIQVVCGACMEPMEADTTRMQTLNPCDRGSHERPTTASAPVA
jgi:hypothetical protein